VTFNFNVDVVLRGRDFAVTEAVTISHGEPASWNDDAVRDVLVGILRAIDRVNNPSAPADRAVLLRGFSWIVEPAAGGNHVVIAIEIPSGAAVAGPFAASQAELDSRISRVLRAEPHRAGAPTVH
jgi:hypothetical protein